MKEERKEDIYLLKDEKVIPEDQNMAIKKAPLEWKYMEDEIFKENDFNKCYIWGDQEIPSSRLDSKSSTHNKDAPWENSRLQPIKIINFTENTRREGSKVMKESEVY